jgi:Tfp pilus assembly protein FimT
MKDVEQEIRCLGSLGALVETKQITSLNKLFSEALSFGKSEAVCQSSPIPKMQTSIVS